MSDRFGMPIVDCRTEEERLREQVAAQAVELTKLRLQCISDFGQYVDGTQEMQEKIQAQAAVIESLMLSIREVFDDAEECQDFDGWTANLVSLEAMHNLDTAYNQALAIPTDNTQILDEVRRAERERCIYVINAQKNPITTSYANGLVFDPANNMVDKCAAAIRAME